MSDEKSSLSKQKKHAAPCSNRDFDFFYEGLEAKQLLVQRCEQCKQLRAPPAPMCPSCHSLNWTAEPVSGKGQIYSYTVHYHPPLPGFAVPHPVGVVNLEEGIRFLAGFDGIALEDLRIGLPVEAEFIRRGEMASVRFRKAATSRNS